MVLFLALQLDDLLQRITFFKMEDVFEALEHIGMIYKMFYSF